MHHCRGAIRGGRTRSLNNIIRHEDFIWYPANVYTWYMWLWLLPDIEKLVFPYRTAKFTETWKYLMADHQAAKTIAKIAESLEFVEPWESGYSKYMDYMRVKVVRDLKGFLHRYQEGALVILTLLDCAGKGGWGTGGSADDISLSEFPGIEGKDPVEVWCLVERLRVLMREALGEKKFSSVFSQYLQYHMEFDYSEMDEELFWAGFRTTVSWSSVYDGIRRRKDVKSLETLLTERWDWFVRHHSAAGELWRTISASPIRYYLLCCAADLLSFGDKYASLPQSGFPPYEKLVSALVWFSKDTKARLDEAEEKEQAAEERKVIEKECAEKVKKISYSPPAVLEARVLDAMQIRAVRNACVKEIKRGSQVVSDVAATIDEFVSFCCILAKPENHMRIKGQYVERQVKTRTEIDMVNEMARVLTALPRYTAYAKVVEEKGGEQSIWKGKIRTAKLIAVREDEAAEARRSVVERRQEYCLPRERIQAEMSRRQAKWRTPRAQAEAPSGGMGEKPPERGRAVPEPEESPPPTRVVAQRAEGTRQKSNTGDPRKERVVPVRDEPPPAQAAPSKKPAGTEEMKEPANVTKMKLLYSSDFTQPTGWEVDNPEKLNVFRRDGFLHIGVYPPRFIYRSPEIRLVDFRAHVTAAFVESTGSVYGVVFRWSSNDKSASFYSLGINQDGKVGIFIHHSDNTWERLLDYRDSEFIHRGSDANTWTVEMVGEKITVGVNGHALASVCDRRLESGVIGLFVSAFDTYAEARFRDFQLYSIASDEGAERETQGMDIANAPVGEIHTDGVWRR